MYLDSKKAAEYGHLVSWDDNYEAMMDCVTRMAYQPGEGLMILEIQQRIFDLLVKCCHEILHDINLSQDPTPVTPEPPVLMDNFEFPTMAMMALETPFRIPTHINFNHLKAIITARRSDVEDHIWALREDPGYFLDVLKDWSEHRSETLLDIHGARHPNLDTPLYWDRVIGSIVDDAYGGLVIWELLCENLTNLHGKFYLLKHIPLPGYLHDKYDKFIPEPPTM